MLEGDAGGVQIPPLALYFNPTLPPPVRIPALANFNEKIFFAISLWHHHYLIDSYWNGCTYFPKSYFDLINNFIRLEN